MGLFDFITSSWDFFKDVSNLDRERDVDASKENMLFQNDLQQKLMGISQGYNKENMDLAYGYNSRLMDQSASLNWAAQDQAQMYNRENMALQQQYNQANMAKQFAYNNYLSSIGRNIIAERSNGINPSGSVGGGSVTAPQAQALSSSPLGVSPSSVGALAGAHGLVSGNSYVRSAVSTSQALESSARASLLSSQKTNQDIKNMTALQGQLQEIDNMIASMKKTYSEKELNETNNKSVLMELTYLKETIVKRLDLMQSEIDKNVKMGNAAEKNAESNAVAAAASAQNANTNQKRSEWEESVARYNATTARKGITIQENQSQSVIDELVARARKHNADANVSDQDVLWYADRIESAIELNESQIEKNVQESRLSEKEADSYYYRLIFDSMMKITNQIPLYGNMRARLIRAVRGKAVQRATTIRKHDVQGNLRTDTWEWSE